MVKKIIKRDGRKKVFDPQKIEKAIYKAQLACGDDDVTLCKMITNKVIDCVNKDYDNKNISVEEVQNIIENVLIEMGEAEIAKAYIRYRAERTKVRERKTNLMKSLHDITFKDSKDEDSKRENANINADTPMGMMLKYGSEAAKQFYLNDLIKPEFATAHIKGDIHIHDLDFYALTMTCCQIDLIDLSRLKLTHFQCFSSDISQMMAQQLYELEQLTLRQQVLKTLISTNQSTFRLDKHQIDESINRIRSQYHVSPSGLFIPRVKSNALAKRDAYDESFTKWSIENFPKQSEWQRLYENIQQQVLMSQENPLQLLYTRLNETKKQRLILQNKIYLLRIQSQLCGQPIFYWDEVYEREVKKQGQHTHLTTGKMLTSKQKIGEIVVCENKYYIHSTT